MHSQRSAARSKDGHFILLCASPCWGILETNNKEMPSHFATGPQKQNVIWSGTMTDAGMTARPHQKTLVKAIPQLAPHVQSPSKIEATHAPGALRNPTKHVGAGIENSAQKLLAKFSQTSAFARIFR